MKSRMRGLTGPLMVFGAMILAMVAACVVTSLAWPIQLCGMKRYTGLPCPFCGGTRSLSALAHLDWLAAFLLNPLVILGCVACSLWLALWVFNQWLRKPWAIALHQSLHRLPWYLILAVLALVNWVYLMLMI